MYRTPTQVADARQMLRRGGGQSRCLSSTFSLTAGLTELWSPRTRRGSDAASSANVTSSPIALRDNQDLRWLWVQLWGRHGWRRGYRQFSTHEQVPRDPEGELRLVVQNGRGLGLLGPLLDLLVFLQPFEVRGQRPCRGPSTTVHDDQAVFTRLVSVATVRAPDRAVRPRLRVQSRSHSASAASEQESPPLMDRSRDRRERGPPRLSTPPTAAGADQSTSWKRGQPLCGLAGAGPLHDRDPCCVQVAAPRRRHEHNRRHRARYSVVPNRDSTGTDRRLAPAHRGDTLAHQGARRGSVTGRPAGGAAGARHRLDDRVRLAHVRGETTRCRSSRPRSTG